MQACSTDSLQSPTGIRHSSNYLRTECTSGCAGKGEAVCTSILQEKLKLLGQTCTNKYLLMPAIFFFLWQVWLAPLQLQVACSVLHFHKTKIPCS